MPSNPRWPSWPRPARSAPTSASLVPSGAFRGLADVQQATLASVAPGIAEALVATAIGLFAAIPAVVAYNRYAYEIERLANRFETFIDEFSNILDRHAR